MNRVAIFTLAALATGLLGIHPAPTVSAQDDGWVTLFAGDDLGNFNVVGDANWDVTGTDVAANIGSGFLVTRESYGDFELTLEFWVSDDANSGVFVRASDPETISAENSYEVNIFDARPDQTYRTGGIVNLASPLVEISTGGQWNTYTITAQGPALSVVLNGFQTVDSAMDDRLTDGPIAFQYGSGVVRFRNIRVRPL
jgi:hypothetical protein